MNFLGFWTYIVFSYLFRAPNVPTTSTDPHCRQTLTKSLLKAFPAHVVSAALRDFACILSGKLPVKTALYNETPRTQALDLTYPSRLPVTDMKFPSCASIASEKTTLPLSDKKETSKDLDILSLSTDTMMNNKNMLSSEKQAQQQSHGLSNDNNNFDMNTNTKNFSDNTVVNNNGNENINKHMVNRNDNDVEHTVLSRPRLHGMESGCSSSGSDEDGAGRSNGCQCDNMHGSGRFRSGRRLRHRLSFSRSQSLSSLDSGVGDILEWSGTYTPSASSVSSLSSMRSLASSGNNLSLSPSLDSLVWNSVVVSSAEVADTVRERVASASECPTASATSKTFRSDSPLICDTIEPRALRSNLPTDDTERRSSLSPESESEKEQEDFVSGNSLLCRNDNERMQQEDFVNHNGLITRDDNERTDAASSPADMAASPGQQVWAQSARHARRRTESRDLNNNTGTHLSRTPQDFLPSALFRLGDCFQKKGLLSLVALILYLLCLMVGFAFLTTFGKGLKAGVL